MKKREFIELKGKSAEELTHKMEEMKDKLHSLKMDLAAGKVKNVREINIIKKDIARILTVLNNQ
ncbi:MAG: 50S ribosomal protein L29 [bacterium]|nr:50S ribosomal protein L29 [bacterium]